MLGSGCIVPLIHIPGAYQSQSVAGKFKLNGLLQPLFQNQEKKIPKSGQTVTVRIPGVPIFIYYSNVTKHKFHIIKML